MTFGHEASRLDEIEPFIDLIRLVDLKEEAYFLRYYEDIYVSR